MKRLVRMNRFVALTLALVMAVYAFAPVGVAAQQAGQNNPNALTVTGAVAGTTNVFNGVLDITRFAVQNGQIVAIGQLTGTLTNTVNGVTTVIGQVNQLVTLPVTPGNATCEILNLQIGAISLNLLGLQIDLAPISLVITAQQGAGNLLGNLLCAVAGLLDRGGPLTGITGLLNNILRILG
jgi:hypothetical protein